MIEGLGTRLDTRGASVPRPSITANAVEESKKIYSSLVKCKVTMPCSAKQIPLNKSENENSSHQQQKPVAIQIIRNSAQDVHSS